jgi:hypothetical protein
LGIGPLWDFRRAELRPLELEEEELGVEFSISLGWRIGGRGEMERESSEREGEVPRALAALSLLTLLSPTLCKGKTYT